MEKTNTDIYSNLTSLEQKIFKIIDEVRQKRTPSTVVRVAGGWVRDKLLGKPSEDIDLMTDNISGADFARLIVDELGLEKSPYVIQENPEKTKNIEAAKVNIPVDGEKVEVDFVQARTEQYGENRREVVVSPATAEEDAMRRDLTINALFYNINENKIEDFTGKGIKDLISGTIRSPYDSGGNDSIDQVKKTFIEDPLRVFRTIRFAAKHNGNISPSTRQAIEDPEVINAIFFSERKIATERIGQEFKKILKGPNPELAIKLLKETGLMQHILNESLKNTKYENEMKPLDMEQNNPHHEMNLWGHTYQVLTNMMKYFPENDEEKRIIMILSALTHDLGKLYHQIHGESESNPGNTSYHGHEKESENIAKYLLRFLKFENNLVNQVSSIVRYHMQPHSLNNNNAPTKAMRKFIRRMGEQSLNWLDVFNISVADAYSKGLEVNPDTIKSYEQLKSQLEQAMLSMQVQENKVQPILDGNQIMNILNVKPGPHISVIQRYLEDIMDEYPETTEAEAIEKLKNIRDSAEKMQENNPNDAPVEDFVVQAIQTRTASNSSKFRLASACPQHLFKQKYADIQKCLKNDRYLEAISLIKKLCKEYPEDNKTIRLAAVTMFNSLAKDPKLRDNALLQLIMDKAEDDMFDPILQSYSVGILIMIKTITDPEAILEIGTDMCKMYPGILKTVVDGLPQNIYHKDILQKLKRELK